MDSAIDNFHIVYDNLLKFDKEGEFYLALILKRRKDTKGKMVEGVNEDNRLIKHFFIYDKEYLQRKEAAIKQLCEQNNARAYILPQRRSHDVVMWELHSKTGEILKSGAKNTHFDHLIRSCVAGCHDVPPDRKGQKRWVIDIDSDNAKVQTMIQSYWNEFRSCTEGAMGIHFVAMLARKLREALVPSSKIDSFKADNTQEFMPSPKRDYTIDDISVLPTPHGWHIVTPPFNRDQKACEKYFKYWDSNWVKPDAMALMFAPKTIIENKEK